MAEFQAGVPAGTPAWNSAIENLDWRFFLFLIAASAAVLELPSVEKDNHDIIKMGEEKAGNSFKVDYRSRKCMPPISEQFILHSDDTCPFTQWALPAVAMAEYKDCMSSKGKVLRDFSVEQVLECALPDAEVACITPNFKKVTDALDYLIYAGIALNATYYETEYQHLARQPPPPPPPGPIDTCHAERVGVVYKLKKGYQNIRALNERKMAEQVNHTGPILATLYLDLKALDTDFGSYSTGIMDSDKICPTSVAGFSYPPVDGESTNGIMLPVMVVGYGKLGGVKVWIVRNDWHGPSWGLGGYFYLKRGVNACNIALNPIRILG